MSRFSSFKINFICKSEDRLKKWQTSEARFLTRKKSSGCRNEERGRYLEKYIISTLCDLIWAVGEREESKITLGFLAQAFGSHQDEKYRERSGFVGRDSQIALG